VLFWLALAVAIVVTVASVAYAAVKGLELFRGVRRLLRQTGEELDALERATGAIESHLEAASASGVALGASMTRLHASRARLNVLTTALEDVRASVRRLTGVYPRK
jgi:hypothetical protein